MPTTVSEVYASNREAYEMARSAGIGGAPGTNPIGDRPGTTTLAASGSAWGTPAGRAHIFAAAAILAVIFLHMAAESRFRE